MKPRSLFDTPESWVKREFKPKPTPATPVVTINGQKSPSPKPIPFVPVAPSPAGASPAVRRIIRIVAETGKVQMADLCGTSQERTLVHYRQFAMWIARRFTDRSLPVIGTELGYRDHTTVLYGARKIQRYISHHGITPSGDTAEDWAYALVSHYRALRAKRDAEVYERKLAGQRDWYQRTAALLKRVRGVKRKVR